MGLLSYFLFSFALQVQAQNLTEVALFARCYSHITQKSLPLNHALKAQVKAGTLTAVDACMRVLDGAKLNASGGAEGNLVSDTAEARDVLLTMNDFHRSWFPNDNIMRAIPYLEDFNGQPYVHDETEPGLHVTRVLLTDGLKFSEIVTGNSAMEALRSNGPSLYNQNAPADKRLKQNSSSVAGSSTIIDFNAPLVQTGQLLGVRRMTLNSAKQNLTTNSVSGSQVGSRYYNSPGPIRVNESRGAGIIGTPSYLLLNLGRANENASDGGLVMNRRWSQSVMKDILCRDLPAIRVSDAAPYVQNTSTPLTPSFRKAGTCMSCHATMDPLAGVVRNLSYAQNYYILYMGTVHIRVWPTTQGPETGPVDLDENFFQRPTRGNLLFRSYDGTLVNTPVNSFTELGTALAGSNDLYVCAASRYFRHFTGIRVNLQDQGDPANVPISAGEKVYRDLVIKLGQDLKSSQSLRSLIRAIISSDLYKKAAMR